MKSSHAESALKRLYAVEKGVPLRTAQHHAKHRHPDYVAFLAAHGAAALKGPSPSPTQNQALAAFHRVPTSGTDAAPVDHISPPAMSKDRALWSPEEYAECEAWTSLCAANAQRDAAVARGDGIAALGYVRIANDTLKAYHFARQKREAAEISAGRLKPISAWESAKAAIMKIVAQLASLEGDLAQTANPSDPVFAIKAIGDWKERKWNPAIRAAIAELDGGIVNIAA